MLNYQKYENLIYEVLTKHKFNSLEVRSNLILLSTAVEGDFGRYNFQIGSETARGVGQMEYATYKDLCNRFGNRWYKRSKHVRFKDLTYSNWYKIHDLELMTLAMAVKFLAAPEKLPANNLNELWLYYKEWYNSYKGATTKEKFYAAYEKHIKPYQTIPE